MLKCREVTHQASDYLDKNMPCRKVVNVRLHLMMCRHCRRFVRHLATTIKVANFRGFPVASPSEIEKVMHAIIRHTL